MSLTEHLVEIKCPKMSFSAHAHKGPGLGCSTSATLHHGNLGLLPCGPLAPGRRWVCKIFSILTLHFPTPLFLFCAQILSSFTELTEAGISQTPRNKVTKMRQEITLRCEPISRHLTLFLHRQTSMQGLEFLFYFSNEVPVDDTRMSNNQFSAQMPNGSFSTLMIQSTELGDSAMYLWVSSLPTAEIPLPRAENLCFPFSYQLSW